MQAFISYAHDDHRAFEDFNACLRPVARAFKINIWADKRLRPGHYWSKKIADAIDASDIHILLMSNSFFASDYIFDHELPAIVTRHQNGAMTAPVLIERCYWSAFVGMLQAAPINPKGKLVPTSEWKPLRTGFSTACEQIAVAIEDHFKIVPISPFSWRKP
jgi:TIR domain